MSATQRRRPNSVLDTFEHKRFLETVNNALEELMEGHGYSRERAAKALLQEITRSIAPSTISVTEEEIFVTMRRHNLGTDTAHRALLVSKILDHIIQDRCLSTPKAIEFLTSHLQNAKLTSNVESSDSSLINEHETATVTSSASGVEHTVRIILPEQKTSRTTKSIHAALSSVPGPIKAKAITTKPTATAEDKSLKRERADSVSEEVVAKLEKKPVASNSKKLRQGDDIAPLGNSKTVVATPIVGRSKRCRSVGEDGDCATNKRTRKSSA